MEFKILGLPFTREGFKISDKYRGICRNQIPESKFEENSKVEFLNDLYVKLITSESIQESVSDLFEITNSFVELSTEPFELIIIKDVKEKIPKNITFEKLGYEVLASNEASMIHFWLREKVVNFEKLYESNVEKLNGNYLFSCISDAEAFANEIKQYSHVVSPSSLEVNFDIFEINLVEGVRGNDSNTDFGNASELVIDTK